tara:strand:+ start:4788 stop:5675 length:888 start_codon:yes stop_codon:yes gene_type:complete
MNMPMLQPQNLKEAMEFSKMIASSEMIPTNYRNKPNDVLCAIQWGNEIGLAPLQALQNIAVINGRPSLWGDSLVAVCKSHPDFRGIEENYIEEEDKAVCVVKRNVAGTIETTKGSFSYKDAQQANLTNKQGPWKQYPKRMLQLRARGFALRDAFPDAIKGIITTEEAMDFPEEKKPQIKTADKVNDTNLIEDIKKKVSSIEESKNTTKYTMTFLGKKSPIVYSNPEDFVMTFINTLNEIHNSNYTEKFKLEMFQKLKVVNMPVIESLTELLRSEIEMEEGKSFGTEKNTTNTSAT